MKPESSLASTPRQALRARLRLGLFLMLLFLIHVVEVYLASPFVDHTTSTQNLIYGLVVTAPFSVTVMIFLFAAWRDLSAAAGER